MNSNSMAKNKLALGSVTSWVKTLRPHLEGVFELSAGDGPLTLESANWADFILPLAYGDYDLLRSEESFLRKSLIPSKNIVKIANDKKYFKEWFSLFFDVKYLANSGDSKLLIAKLRDSYWGLGSYIIPRSDAKAIEKAKLNSAIILEDYIEGNLEYTTHILFDKGEKLYSALTTYTHEKGVNHIQGEKFEAIKVEIKECQEVPDIFLEVLKKFNYSGFCCFNYKIDASGQLKIMELNARFGGSLSAIPLKAVELYVERIKSRR